MLTQQSIPGLVIVFVYLVATFIGGAGSQNCGFPSSPIHLNPVLENATLGQVLESIRTVNLRAAEYNLTCGSPQLDPESAFPFIHIATTPVQTPKLNQNQTQTLITLYLHSNANLSLLVDFFKVTSCEVRAEIKCSDGKKKLATFMVPLTDLNTKPPIFLYPVVNLNVVLPWHSEVPLIYDAVKELVVEDQDRDCQNTEIVVSVRDPVREDSRISSWFKVRNVRDAGSSNTCEQEQEQEHESNLKSLSLGSYTDQHHRHVISIYLQPYVSPYDLAQFESLTLIIQARNLYPSSNSTAPSPRSSSTSSAVVHIQFSVAALDFYPPRFSQPVYTCSIHNLIEAGLRSLRINAFDPDGLTEVRYEVLAHTQNNTSFGDMNGSDRNFLGIDPYTGELYFIRQLTAVDVKQFSHAVGVFLVKAVQKDTALRYSIATLLIYFEFDEYEEPPTTTTGIPTSSTGTSTTSWATSTTTWTTPTTTTSRTTTTPDPEPEPSTIETDTDAPTPTSEPTPVPTNPKPTTEPVTEPSTTEWTETEAPTNAPGPTTARPSTSMPTRPTRPTPRPSTTSEPEPEPEPTEPTSTTMTTTAGTTTTITTTTEPPECVRYPDPVYCNRYFACEPVQPYPKQKLPYPYTLARDIVRDYSPRSMCCSRDVLHLIYCQAKDRCINPDQVDDACPGCRGMYDESCMNKDPEKPWPPSTTTTNPPDDEEPEPECRPDSFHDQADPRYCNRYLSCRDGGNGGMITESICCAPSPAYLVYCQPENRCMYEWELEQYSCPCEAEKFDTSCPNATAKELQEEEQKQQQPLDSEFRVVESTAGTGLQFMTTTQILVKLMSLAVFHWLLYALRHAISI